MTERNIDTAKPQKLRVLVVPLISVSATLVFCCVAAILNTPPWVIGVGAVLFLLPLFLSRWSSWRTTGTRWGGVFLLFPAAYCAGYALGSVPIGSSAPLNARPDGVQWAIYAIGIVCFLIGGCFFTRNVPLRPDLTVPRTKRLTVAYLAAVAGLGGAGINYVTGGIPLLAANINALRFGGNVSLLGPATGLIVGVEQAALVVLAISWYSAHKLRERTALITKLLIVLLLLSLILSAARSFLILPIVAFMIAVFEFKVIRPLTFLVLVVLAFTALTGYNLYRVNQSGTSGQLTAALESRGVGGIPLASGLLGLQIGPSVMQMSRDKIPSELPFQKGQFFLADGAVILRTHSQPSDYFTTVEVTGRDYLQVGGTPPTVLGGFYIDGGVPLIVFGMVILGILSRLFRNHYLRVLDVYAGAAYGYWTAWLILSIYSYISLKPAVISFLLVVFLGQLVNEHPKEQFGCTLPVGVTRHGVTAG